jgi:beta-galactosidase
MDTCGFPKDIYYYYQSWWTDHPVLHLMPHWNWPDKIGQQLPVRVFSNCKEVELFLNGKSLGQKTMRPNWFLEWSAVYEEGVLSAKGYDAGKLVAEAKVETTGTPTGIQICPDRATLRADGTDCAVTSVAVVDAKGRTVPTADNNIQFSLAGPGKIIGVGNGDPSSHEADQADERKVFGGLAQILVQSGFHAGVIRLTATSPGLRTAILDVRCEPAAVMPLGPLTSAPIVGHQGP